VRIKTSGVPGKEEDVCQTHNVGLTPARCHYLNESIGQVWGAILVAAGRKGGKEKKKPFDSSSNRIMLNCWGEKEKRVEGKGGFI